MARREWVSVRRSPSTGTLVVTVTVMEDNRVVRWPQRTYRGHIRQDEAEARRQAEEVLAQLTEPA